jgi:hypothetical protein
LRIIIYFIKFEFRKRDEKDRKNIRLKMALYDRAEAARKEKAKESYEALKKHITSVGDDNKVNDFLFAYDHIRDMEKTIERQTEELKKYREFFIMLDKLTPGRKNKPTIYGNDAI